MGVKLMKKIKQTIDPNNIMNPGKIFPSDEEIEAEFQKSLSI